MTEWRSLWALAFLIPLLAILIWNYINRNKRRPSLQFSSVKIFQNVQPTIKARLMVLPTMLKVLAIVIALFAMARPQSADSIVKKNTEGIDIMITLDVSDSMLIEDMVPVNRLETAKETIKNFIQNRSSDRIGLLVFAGESFTAVPLTLDYDLILSRLKEVKTAQQARIKDGTALGVALANAAGRLKDSTAKTRVVIFMTDGENNSGTIDPETGLEIAKGYGVKIYSIGLGKDGPTKLPITVRDAFGNTSKIYQPFESYVNDDLLGRMAKDTGGKYWRASKEDSLQNVFNEIDRLEKTKIDINKFTRYKELYMNYLIWAFWIYVLGVALGRSVFRRMP
jgi:Ca-activated chloride channel homolog